jgi:hypothetical protein
MKASRSVLAVALAASVLSAPAQAGLLEKNAVKSGEAIGTAAKGDPKPYHALVQGTCDAGLCIVNFGKKAKDRRIDLVSCGVITDGDPALAGVIFGDLTDGDARFYMPVASVAPQGAGKVGIFSSDFTFDVPAGTKMQVALQTSGTPSIGACTVTGTIR